MPASMFLPRAATALLGAALVLTPAILGPVPAHAASPSVMISGPGVITVKAKYAFTAVHSGLGNQPVFLWHERFCSDAASENCTDWVATINVPATYNRVLIPDCSGAGENSFQLAVVATGNGLQAKAEHRTWLCIQ
ncbi:hypothetical protein [Longispora albida]|uniref:hypothetical protein n=1 Tax=Longispora albida TaxID=203523 RepID=UPI000380C038|nr:hypothetical protein [Longispora albida]